jgi:hypothetical protein
MPKAVKNGVVCSSRLTWYRRENLPCLRQLRFANRGFIEKVMEVIWDQQVDKSGFKCFDFNSEELAYQLAADETEIKAFLLDRRTVEALEQAKTYMDLQDIGGVSLMVNSVTNANKPTDEAEDDLGGKSTPTVTSTSTPTPAATTPAAKECTWSDEGWSQIYLDAREEIKAIWPKTAPGVVNDIRHWVGNFTNTEPKKVTKEQREEWVPRILEVLKASTATENYTKFKNWMEKSGAAKRIKNLGDESVLERDPWIEMGMKPFEGGEIPLGWKRVLRNSKAYLKPVKGFEDPDVREDAEEFERQKAIAEQTGIF